MKKIISSILAGLFLVSSIFAGIMDDRFFEIRTEVPVHLSNNVFSLLDAFQSDVFVLDLADIANDIPDDGAVLTTGITPNLSVSLDIARVYIGVKAEVDIYGSFGIDNSIFDFLGYGLALQQVLRVSPSINGEVYAAFGPDIGFNLNGMKFRVNPSVFVPLIYLETGDTYFEFQNTTEGKFSVNMKGDISMYSQFGMKDDSVFGGINIQTINVGDKSISYRNMTNDMWLSRALAVAGVDLAGSVEIDSSVSGLSFIGSVRCPIIPGKLYTKTSFTSEKPIETSFAELMDYNFDMTSFVNNVVGDFDYNLESQSVVYSVNRPFKLNGYAVYNPRKFVALTTGVGMGLRSPFSDKATVFPEYYISGALNLFGGLLKTSISTEYTNQIFSHSTMLGLSLRVIEVDMAMGIESPSFIQSFNVTGLNFSVGVAMGF